MPIIKTLTVSEKHLTPATRQLIESKDFEQYLDGNLAVVVPYMPRLEGGSRSGSILESVITRPDLFPGELVQVMLYAANLDCHAIQFIGDEQGNRIPSFPWWSSEGKFVMLDDGGMLPSSYFATKSD